MSIHLSGGEPGPIILADHSVCFNEDPTHEFHNSCHARDGKFCPGAGGKGRIREIKNPKARAKAEADNKEIAKDADNRGAIRKAAGKAAQKDPDKTEEQVIKDAQKEVKKGATPEEAIRKATAPDDMGARKVATQQDKMILSEAKDNAWILKGSASREKDPLLKQVFTDSADWWGKEAGRVQDEIDGKPVKRDKQAIGKTIKPPAWPKNNDDRPIDVVAQGKKSFLGRTKDTEIDGIKVKRAYDITAADGTKLRVYDMDGKDRTGDLKGMANQMARMHELYPTKPAQKMVLLSDKQTNQMAGRAEAFTMPGDNHVFYNKAALNRNKGPMRPKGWMMPSAAEDGAEGNKYIMTHEYGHQFDASNGRGSARWLAEDPNIKIHLSNYASYHPAEAYAETFAEWHYSEGKTKNPAAIAYAQHEGWYGAKKSKAITAAAIQLSQVTADVTVTLVTEEEWDGWKLAKALGIIAAAAPEEDGDIVFEKLKVPMIKEDFRPGKGPSNTLPKPLPVSAEVKAETASFVKQIFEELGVPYEEG